MSQQCCTHKLTACDDTEDVIYTKSAGLRKRVGKVVTLSSPADSTCRTVERFCGSLPEGESWTAVTVDEEFEDCEECGVISCEYCDTTPTQVKVVISGVTNFSCICTDVNGTFYLDNGYLDHGGNGGTTCDWGIDLGEPSGGCISPAGQEIRFTVTSATAAELVVIDYLLPSGSSPHTTGRWSITEDSGCVWEDDPMSLALGGVGICNFSSATILITSV